MNTAVNVGVRQKAGNFNQMNDNEFLKDSAP
jgi:hypothetical protein